MGPVKTVVLTSGKGRFMLQEQKQFLLYSHQKMVRTLEDWSELPSEGGNFFPWTLQLLSFTLLVFLHPLVQFKDSLTKEFPFMVLFTFFKVLFTWERNVMLGFMCLVCGLFFFKLFVLFCTFAYGNLRWG